MIFASLHGGMPVSDQWFEHAPRVEVFDTPVRVIAPTELIWSKAFVQIDWRRLLGYMDLHWEVLLVHLLNFRWAYPSERNRVPLWLMHELLDRLEQQLDLPPPRVKTCQGRMLSPIDYEWAVKEWGFTDISEGKE